MDAIPQSPIEEVRALLAGDDPLARGGLYALLNGQAGVKVVGQATVDELPAALQSLRPEVAVWDLGLDPRALLPRLSALEVGDLPLLALVPDDRAAAEVLGAGA